MNTRHNKIWFPAKTYGYGWGPPVCWQGWVVMAVFAVLVGAGVIVIPQEKHMEVFLGYMAALVAGLILMCWWKGEKPAWRWGPPKSKGDDNP
ncbi:MAG: hypothetical protein WC661_20185 [Opitutaceae bacterium]|jgi:uncharacterized membrane protein YhaH (DUF805 family)